MDAALGGHLIPQEPVDEAVARGLHLRPEGLGCDDEAEVCLSRRAALHGLVVRIWDCVRGEMRHGRRRGMERIIAGSEDKSYHRLTLV